MTGERRCRLRIGHILGLAVLGLALGACSTPTERPGGSEGPGGEDRPGKAARPGGPDDPGRPHDLLEIAKSDMLWPEGGMREVGDMLLFHVDGHGATREEATQRGNVIARNDAISTRRSRIQSVLRESGSTAGGEDISWDTEITSQGALSEVPAAHSLASRRLDDGTWLVRVELKVPREQVFPNEALERIKATRNPTERALGLREFIDRAQRRQDRFSVANGRRELLVQEPGIQNLGLCAQALVDVGDYTEALAQIAGYRGDDADEATLEQLRDLVHRAMPDVVDTIHRLVLAARTAQASDDDLALRIHGLRDGVAEIDAEVTVRAELPDDSAAALIWIDEGTLQVWTLLSPSAGGTRTAHDGVGSAPWTGGQVIQRFKYEKGDEYLPGEAHILVLAATGRVGLGLTEIDLDACARKDPNELRRLSRLTEAISAFMSDPGHDVGIVSWIQKDV